jgi:hypothetical protein
VAEFKVSGATPFVQNAFPKKAREKMHEQQASGARAKKGQKREPKDFDLCYEQSKHKSREGWLGIPAAAFRNALISACRTVGFKMTLAKLAVFIVADGFDAVDGMPLVRIEGEPRYVEHYVRNATGVVDLRARAMFEEWGLTLRIRFDADLFSLSDIANLLMRAGVGGVGDGRNDSPNSAGMGWGEFSIEDAKRVSA